MNYEDEMAKRKAPLTRPQHVRDDFIKRHFQGGESIATLVKAFKISRATGHNWANDYKRDLARAAISHGSDPKDVDRVAKQELVAQNEMLRAEIRKLRDRLVDLMVKHNEIP